MRKCQVIFFLALCTVGHHFSNYFMRRKQHLQLRQGPLIMNRIPRTNKRNLRLEQNIISDFKQFKPEKIILFGSYAKEENDAESDIDIIVVYQTEKKFMNRLEELYLSWTLPKAVDILAYTPDEFDQMQKENFFIQDAVKEGIVIYESIE